MGLLPREEPRFLQLVKKKLLEHERGGNKYRKKEFKWNQSQTFFILFPYIRPREGSSRSTGLLHYPWTPAGLSTKASDWGVNNQAGGGEDSRVRIPQAERTHTFLPDPPRHHLFKCPWWTLLLFAKDLLFFLVSFALQLWTKPYFKMPQAVRFSWAWDRHYSFSLHNIFWISPCYLICYAFTTFLPSQPWPILTVIGLV